MHLGKEAIMSNKEQEYIKKLGKSGAVVPKMMADLYGKGITCMLTTGTPVKNFFVILKKMEQLLEALQWVTG